MSKNDIFYRLFTNSQVYVHCTIKISEDIAMDDEMTYYDQCRIQDFKKGVQMTKLKPEPLPDCNTGLVRVTSCMKMRPEVAFHAVL